MKIKYKVGDRFVVREPMSKHYNKIIVITRVACDCDYESSYYKEEGNEYDVYYRLENEENHEFGFQKYSIFEDSLERID